MTKFRLLGHDCPYGRYPAPVIPIGEDLDCQSLVAVYPEGDSGPAVHRIEADATYVRHGEVLARSLQAFDWCKDRLFAFSPQHVEAYPTNTEAEFFASVLKRSELERSDPFLRLMLAGQTRKRKIILPELEECYRQLKRTSPDSADDWLRDELALLPQEVFVVVPYALRDSAITTLISETIWRSERLVPCLLEWEASGVRITPALQSQVVAAEFVVAVWGSGTTESEATEVSPDVSVDYTLSIAAALEKSVVALTVSGHALPPGARPTAVVEYSPSELLTLPARHRLSSKLAQAIAQLQTAAKSQVATSNGIYMANDFRKCAFAIFQFASGIRGEGNVLIPALRKVFDIASGQASESPGADFHDHWNEYERLHVNRFAHRLNGDADRTEDRLFRYIQTITDAPATLRTLEIDFHSLRKAMESYRRAFERANEYAQALTPRPATLLTVIDPLDQTLRNLTSRAENVINGLMITMLDSTSLPDISVRDAPEVAD